MRAHCDLNATLRLRAITAGFTLLLSAPIFAGNTSQSQEENEKQYCYTMFGVTAGSGEHICNCVNEYNRAVQQTRWDDIKFYAQSAVGDCSYFMGRHKTDTGKPLDKYYPVAQMYRGMAHVLLKDTTRAAQDFLESIQRNPKESNTYAQLADLYLKIGSKKKTLAILAEGLKHAPASKQLLRRYTQLSGKEYQLPPQTAQEEKTAANAPNSEKGKEDNKPQDAVQQKAPTQAISGQEPQRGDVPASTTIGSPANPWCRFCTDTPAAPAGATPSTPGVIPKAAP